MATLPEGVGLDTSLKYVDRPTNTFMIDWSSRQISGMGSGLGCHAAGGGHHPEYGAVPMADIQS